MSATRYQKRVSLEEEITRALGTNLLTLAERQVILRLVQTSPGSILQVIPNRGTVINLAKVDVKTLKALVDHIRTSTS